MGNGAAVRPATGSGVRRWKQSQQRVCQRRACLPSLIARRGNVLFVASIASLAAGRRPAATSPPNTQYDRPDAFSRAGYTAPGVRANAIVPGWVTTPMADEEMQPLMDAQGYQP
jgi:NAD(P)-dependent dehydrogenase (short-subunit alcohol dehydrogenase family)